MMKSNVWFLRASAVSVMAVWAGCSSSTSGTNTTAVTTTSSNSSSGSSLVTSSTSSSGSGLGGSALTTTTSTSSGSGTGGSLATTTSTSGSTTTATSTSGTTTTSTSSGSGNGGATGTGGGDAGTTIPYECTVPSTPPSAGSCVTIGGYDADAGTGFQCNPVTNDGCQSGYACDVDTDSTGKMTLGFSCYQPPNDAAVCGACETSQNGPFCSGGSTCFEYDSAGDSVCAKYCCTDADCGAGTCQTTDGMGNSLFSPASTTLGICVTP